MKKISKRALSIIYFLFFSYLSAEVQITKFLTLGGDIALTLVADKNNAYHLNKNDFHNPFSSAHIFLFPYLRLRDNLFIIGDFLIQAENSSRITRVVGLYLIYSPFNRPEFNLKIGMIPTPFGTFSPRAYPHSNFLIGYPLMRQYQTGLSYEELSESVTDLIQNKEERHDKISPIDEIYWDSGIQIFGEYNIFEYSLGITQGALSWPEPLKDKTPGKQIIGRIGLKPVMGLNFGISYAKGNYFELTEEYNSSYDPSIDRLKAEDFQQEALGFDYHFSKGHLIIQGEGLFTRWNSPPIQDTLPASSFYAEVRYKLLPHLFIGGRYDELKFHEVNNEVKEKVRWDSNVRRVELGLGYSIIKNLTLKISYQNWIIFSSPRKKYNQLASQLNYHF